MKLVWRRSLLGIAMVHTLLKASQVRRSGTIPCNFRSIVSDNSPRETRKTRVLLFNQQTRNATALLLTLFTNCSILFDKAIFCSNVTFKEGYKEGMRSCDVCLLDLMSMNTSAEDVGSLKVQHELKAAWEELSKETEVYVMPSIEEAVETIRSWEGEKEVFVTGSLHLVGGLFLVLDGGQR